MGDVKFFRPSESRVQMCRWALLGLILIQALPATAQTPPLPRKAAGRQAAILVGCEAYTKVPPLIYVTRDVQKLGQILRDRGGFDDVQEFTDTATAPAQRPTKSALMTALGDSLKRRGPDDTVIVYFSGHGFRDASGALYLAPLDTDPADLTGTAIPIAWVRDQIAQCRARIKLLILDACHAGTTKGDSLEANISPQELALFEQLEGVITLASSTADQPSQIWEERQHSLFTYWLNQGLKGHADEDGNGEINVDELYEYVHDNVTQSARARLNRPQTPVRKIGLRTPGTPVCLYLRPQKLKQVLAEMAEQLADSLADHQLASVGVLEFTNNTKLGELLGVEYGLLGKYCADHLEERLVAEQKNRFKVVNRRTLQQAIRDQKFSVDDLGSPQALQSLSTRSGGMPAIAIGILNGRAGRMVTLRCQLLRTRENEVATVVGGKAWLNESEWAMLGKSAAVTVADARPDPAAPGTPPVPREDVVVQRLDQQAEGPHPLADPATPYRVWLTVNGQTRQGTFQGNRYLVPLRKGEEYSIHIENRSQEPAYMRLLVDGLNTLPELESAGAASADASATNSASERPPAPASAGVPMSPPLDKGLATYLLGKHVNLNEARGWILDPRDPDRLEWARLNRANPNVYAIQGFVTREGKEGEMARFTVVDASQSLAARQQFTTQVGMITAAFYTVASEATGGVARGIGTDLGRRVGAGDLTAVKATCGQLRVVMHIHYYNPDEGPPMP